MKLICNCIHLSCIPGRVLTNQQKAAAAPAIFYQHKPNGQATRYPHSCYVTKVEVSCTCIQVPAMSETCFKKFNSMNILQHFPSDFVAEPAPGYTCSILLSRSRCVAAA